MTCIKLRLNSTSKEWQGGIFFAIVKAPFPNHIRLSTHVAANKRKHLCISLVMDNPIICYILSIVICSGCLIGQWFLDAVKKLSTMQ